MQQFDDASALVDRAVEQLGAIAVSYDDCIAREHVNASLLINVKNAFENLRSALDFAAHGVYEKHCPETSPKPKVYFPYATADQQEAQFRRNGRIEKCIPGISSARPDIVDSIVSMQHFAAKGVQMAAAFYGADKRKQACSPRSAD
jgi:hypothetical protein